MLGDWEEAAGMLRSPTPPAGRTPGGTRVVRVAVAASTGMVVAVAGWMIMRTGSPVTPASAPSKSSNERSAGPQARRRSEADEPGPRPTRPTQDAVGKDADPPDADASVRRAVLGPVEAGESELSQTWDELTPDERTGALRDRLEAALTGIERHGATAQRIAKAESALSDLRAELYASERGRAEHQGYEARLDAAQRDSGHR